MSTSGGCSHHLRLFLGRSVGLKRRNNSNNNKQSIGGQPISDANKHQTTNQLKTQLLLFRNNCDNSYNSYCVDQQQNQTLDSIPSDTLRLHRHRQQQARHRRSYSLNDITLLLDILDEYNTDNDTNCLAKCSTFKRTLSYLSGKSLIRRRLKSKKIMGQNSSSNNLDTNTVSGVGSGTGNSGALTVKPDKRKDSCNPDELTQLRDELRATKLQLYDRDQQLLKLHREIHKMKSVLEQTSLTMKSPAKSSIGSTTGPIKKCGVSGECFSLQSTQQMTITKVSKDYRSKQLIKEALLDNSFLRHFLDTHQLKLIVDAMYEKEFAKNCLICKQGMYGSHLYVIAYGHCEIIDNKNQLVNQLGPTKAFGELALLYNCTRTATVKVLMYKMTHKDMLDAIEAS